MIYRHRYYIYLFELTKPTHRYCWLVFLVAIVLPVVLLARHTEGQSIHRHGRFRFISGSFVAPG